MTKVKKNKIEKKQMAFFINSMTGGGAEKVVQLLIQQLIKGKESNIILILLENKITYQLPKNIKIIHLFSHLDNYLQKFIGLLYGSIKLKSIIKRYKIQIIISSLERSNFVNVMTKFLGSPHKAIISEHTNPEYTYGSRTLKNSIVKLLLKLLYGKADRIIAVSNGVKKALIKVFKIDERKIQVIYNPCDINKIKKLSMEKVEYPWFSEKIPIIITIGRLIEKKGHGKLIQAFAKIKKQIPSKLVIIGEGNLRKQLERLTVKFEVEKDIAFLGWQENPYKYISKSNIFVLSSNSEPFGLVVVEAMVCGIPVVSFDCESGPREILDNGEYGILVPVGDIEGLSEAVINILKNNDLREKIIQRAKKRVHIFNTKDIAKEYMKCIKLS